MHAGSYRTCTWLLTSARTCSTPPQPPFCAAYALPDDALLPLSLLARMLRRDGSAPGAEMSSPLNRPPLPGAAALRASVQLNTCVHRVVVGGADLCCGMLCCAAIYEVDGARSRHG